MNQTTNEAMLEELYEKDGIMGVKKYIDELEKSKIYISSTPYGSAEMNKTLQEIDRKINEALSFMMRKTFKKNDGEEHKRYSKRR